MGYSCSVRASMTLDAIMCLSEFDRDDLDYKYFVEIGEENEDGAITGTVYELLAGNTQCIKKGGFRIEADGKIKRFPGVSKRLWGVIEIAMIERYDREYQRMCICG